MNENPTPWNKEDICDGELRALLQRVDEICCREELPYYFALAFKNEPESGESSATGYVMSIAPGPGGVSDPRLVAAMHLVKGHSPLTIIAALVDATPAPSPEPSLN